MDASIRLQCPKVACISREMCFSKFRIFLAHFKCFSKPTFLESSWKCAQLPSPLSSSFSSSSSTVSFLPPLLSSRPFSSSSSIFSGQMLSLSHTPGGKKGLEGGWVGSVASSSLFFLRSLSPLLPLFPRSSNAVLRSCRRCGARLKNSFINHNSYFEYGGEEEEGPGGVGGRPNFIFPLPPFGTIYYLDPSFLFAGGGFFLPSLVDKKRKEKEPSSTSFPFSWQNNLSIPFS